MRVEEQGGPDVNALLLLMLIFIERFAGWRSHQFPDRLAGWKQELRPACMVINGGILIDTQMAIHGRPQVSGRERTVLRVLASGIGRADNLAVPHTAT